MNFLKTHLVFLTLSIFSYTAISQTNFKWGVGLESNHTIERVNGITPSLVLDFTKHQVKLGPRINYDIFLNQKSAHDPKFIIDLAYHYNFYSGKKVKVYSELRMEYSYSSYTSQWFYRPDEPSPTVLPPLGEVPFEVLFNYRYHRTSIYLGIGSELKVHKNLFVFGNVNYGTHWRTGKSIYTDVITNSTVLERNYFFSHYHSIGVFASIGLKYQFGSKT